MFKFRHSKGAVADRDFTHSTRLEVIWTVVPVVLLVLMAFPATSKLINMLAIIWFRCAKGHFNKEHHFAFEAVAWYWHFVDVVWLGLFLFVYVL